jgi:hypothetical protein
MIRTFTYVTFEGARRVVLPMGMLAVQFATLCDQSGPLDSQAEYDERIGHQCVVAGVGGCAAHPAAWIGDRQHAAEHTYMLLAAAQGVA